MVRKRRRLELRKTLFLLPNLITLSSIFCGFDSIRVSATATTENDFYRAALLIVFAMFFDTLDGRVARMTKTQSAFGLQIDSLADVVSFGVAPSILVYQWTLHRFDTVGLVVAFLFTALGAVRLARFNVLSMGESGKPTKPSKYIVGLPIPGAAGILVSIVVANHAAGGMIGNAEYAAAILGVTLLLSLLMVSTIRFRSFKDVKLNARTMAFVAFAIGSSAFISAQLKPAFVLVWLLGVYVMLGICESLWQLPGRLRGGVQADARSSAASLPPRDSVPPGTPPL
ncbi:CDP-diacylglycerol--serine O-phosphatidyltransferase [Chondromyces crocatus]|uniref:CDP-diacylglycerol--serine O-phosphatidyltransferase n=1 Tax=Chondromyces crocatus TaxID=52 RepID=A0A0K1EN59_CHOCO|nr:CDP-diacylglycerol--serine O-phosphatidyltransferase [Chondromyces crocatus]AKT42355.1 CDP-diacylglycerol--serine O-phosphatidyltransferase [Chondromyces crocatus]